MSMNPEIVFKSFQDSVCIKSKIEKLEVYIVSCVLQKAADKLLVVKELLKGAENKELAGYRSPAIRMKQRTKIVPPNDLISHNSLSSQRVKEQISFLVDLFEETLSELKFLGTPVYLEYILCCENLKLYDNQMIKQENKNYTKLTHLFKEKIQRNKEKYKEIQHFLLESTGPCLNKAFVNVYAEEHLGKLYGSIREETRINKNFYKLNDNNRTVQQFTEKLNTETEEENQIHQEINSHLSLLLTELTNRVEYWTNKYNTEIEQLDIDLLQMKSQKDDQSTVLEVLKQSFQEKKKEMKILKEESDSRDRERENKFLQNKAAEKIQRWWKNILFTRKLLKKLKQKSPKSSVKRDRTKKSKG